MTEKDFENNNSSGLIFRRKLRTSDEMILEPTGSRLIPEMDRKRCFPDHNPKIMNFKSTIHQLFFFFFFNHLNHIECINPLKGFLVFLNTNNKRIRFSKQDR